VTTRLLDFSAACQRNKEMTVEKAVDTTPCIALGTPADMPNYSDAAE